MTFMATSYLARLPEAGSLYRCPVRSSISGDARAKVVSSLIRLVEIGRELGPQGPFVESAAMKRRCSAIGRSEQNRDRRRQNAACRRQI